MTVALGIPMSLIGCAKPAWMTASNKVINDTLMIIREQLSIRLTDSA